MIKVESSIDGDAKVRVMMTTSCCQRKWRDPRTGHSRWRKSAAPVSRLTAVLRTKSAPRVLQVTPTHLVTDDSARLMSDEFKDDLLKSLSLLHWSSLRPTCHQHF